MEYKNEKTANRRRYKSRYHSPHNYKTKRSKSENRAAILVGIATFIVLTSLVLVFTFGDNIYKFLDDTFHPSTISDAKADAQGSTLGVVAETATEQGGSSKGFIPSITVPSEGASTPQATQSADFERLLKASGLNAAKITSQQLIFVESSGTNATVYTFEKDSSGKWNQVLDPISGFTGEGGVKATTAPGDNVTPKGNFAVEYAMGTNEDPGTMLEYREIYEGMRWITDPASINYNRLLDDDAATEDFETYQDLTEYTVSYPYCLILNYNRDPVDPAKGCAKFLHISAAPTPRGGVGISESDLYNILLWLNPSKKPYVCIF